eukprot:11173934-Lingulodinium_polyedra.AAC.1
MQSWKFEAALSQVAREHESLCGESFVGPALSTITKHVQTLFGLVRECKFEQLHCDDKYQRYRRTGGFRRRLTAAGIADLLEDTLAKVELDTAEESRETSEPDSLCSTQSYPEETKVVEEDWPDCFTPRPARQNSEGEWPLCFTPVEPVIEFEIDDNISPILPSGKKRKATVCKQRDGKGIAKGLGCSKCRYAKGGCARCR